MTEHSLPRLRLTALLAPTFSTMSYVDRAPMARKNLTGLGVVALLHVVLAWALLNGLARKIVDVVKAPIETKIIEEVKPPPPPPPDNLPPPPKLAAPPPSFVPPPEVQIANPPPMAPAITVTKEAPPPAPPVAIAPPPAPAPAPAAPAPPPPPPAPAPKVTPVAAKIDVATCEKPAYPAAALRAEVMGTSKIRFTVDANGVVSKAEVATSAGSGREARLLDNAAIDALSKCRFKPGIDEHGKLVGGTTVVEYVWKID